MFCVKLDLTVQHREFWEDDNVKNYYQTNMDDEQHAIRKAFISGELNNERFFLSLMKLPKLQSEQRNL